MYLCIFAVPAIDKTDTQHLNKWTLIHLWDFHFNLLALDCNFAWLTIPFFIFLTIIIQTTSSVIQTHKQASAGLRVSDSLRPSVPTEHVYPLTLCVDAILSTGLSRWGLIFSESPTPLQNLIWEWHLGALLSASSHRTSIHTISPPRHWAGICSSPNTQHNRCPFS